MSSSTFGRDDDEPYLICQIDCVHGMVDAPSSVRWKRHQDAVMKVSTHGIVLTVEESGCLQVKVFLKREVEPPLRRASVCSPERNKTLNGQVPAFRLDATGSSNSCIQRLNSPIMQIPTF